MPDRSASGRRAGRPPVAELLLICCAVVDGHLAVLTRSGGSVARAALPAVPLPAGEDPDVVAARAARTLLGRGPAWIAQGAVTGSDADSGLVIHYGMLVAAGTAAPADCAWQRIGRRTTLAGGAAKAVAEVVALLRRRMDLEPIAFRMLPPTFTLSELQRLYELLLGRKVHKASFRRSLQASGLVQPIETWRSEGRGRPAQLFRYAPRRGRGEVRRSVRFELLR